MSYSPWSHKELDMTERLTFSLFLNSKKVKNGLFGLLLDFQHQIPCLILNKYLLNYETNPPGLQRCSNWILRGMIMLREKRAHKGTQLMQLPKIYGPSSDRAQKWPCGQGKEKVKEVLWAVFYQQVSSVGSKSCNQKQREVTQHQKSHLGKAKEDPKGRKGDFPGLLG